MISAVAVVAIATFLTALWRLRIVSIATEALATTTGAMAALRDAAADDRQREHAMQRASLRLFGQFAALVGRASLGLALSFVPIGLAALLGLATVGQVVAFLERWQTGLLTTAMAALGYVARTRLWRTS